MIHSHIDGKIMGYIMINGYIVYVTMYNDYPLVKYQFVNWKIFHFDT